MKKVLAAVLIGLAVGSALFAAEDGKMEMYAKATIGYGSAGAKVTVNNKWDYDKSDLDNATIEHINKNHFNALDSKSTISGIVSGFEITPAFGFGIPFSVDQNWGAIKFAVEAQVPIVFGTFVGVGSYSVNNASAFAMKPGAMFVAGYYFPSDFPEWLQKLSPHMGTGFSIPIVSVSGSASTIRNVGINTAFMQTFTTQFSGVGVGFCWDIMTGVQYDFNEHISAVIDWNQAIGGTYGGSFRAGAIWRF